MRLTKFNPETGEYEYIAIARTQEENNARRKAVLQRLGEFENRAEGEWISVDDRLPQPFVSVLVYMPDEVPHPTVREGFINKRGEWYAGGFDRLPDEVAAWKEMPEPPKMKGAKNEQR